MMGRPWVCRECGRILAMVNEQAIEVRMSHGREYRQTYRAQLPATAICRCGAENAIQAPRAEQENEVRR